MRLLQRFFLKQPRCRRFFAHQHSGGIWTHGAPPGLSLFSPGRSAFFTHPARWRISSHTRRTVPLHEIPSEPHGRAKATTITFAASFVLEKAMSRPGARFGPWPSAWRPRETVEAAVPATPNERTLHIAPDRERTAARARGVARCCRSLRPGDDSARTVVQPSNRLSVHVPPTLLQPAASPCAPRKKQSSPPNARAWYWIRDHPSAPRRRAVSSPANQPPRIDNKKQNTRRLPQSARCPPYNPRPRPRLLSFSSAVYQPRRNSRDNGIKTGIGRTMELLPWRSGAGRPPPAHPACGPWAARQSDPAKVCTSQVGPRSGVPFVPMKPANRARATRAVGRAIRAELEAPASVDDFEFLNQSPSSHARHGIFPRPSPPRLGGLLITISQNHPPPPSYDHRQERRIFANVPQHAELGGPLS